MQCHIIVVAILALLHFAAARSHWNNVGRDVVTRRTPPQPSCPDLKFPSSNGGRKVALLIENTSWMNQRDPNGFSLTAAELINHSLISKAQAIDGRQADLVTVVEGHGPNATVFYPLGDPSNVNFSGIGVSGYLFSGLDITIDELTKDGGDVGRLGMVVITTADPINSQPFADSLDRTAPYDIRVSYVDVDPYFTGYDKVGFSPQTLLTILKRGGMFCVIPDAASLPTSASLVTAQGLTGSDNGTTISALIPGFTYGALLLPSSWTNFTYQAQASELVTFSASCVGNCSATLIIRNLSNGTIIETEHFGIEITGLTSPQMSTGNYTYGFDFIPAKNYPTDQVVLVGVNSSFGYANCASNTTTSTATPSPRPSASIPSLPAPLSPAAPERGLSAGAKAGIGLGAAAAGITIVLAMIFCVGWRRGQSKDLSGLPDKPVSDLEVSTGQIYPIKAELSGVTNGLHPVEIMTEEPRVELEAPSPVSAVPAPATEVVGAQNHDPASGTSTMPVQPEA